MGALDELDHLLTKAQDDSTTFAEVSHFDAYRLLNVLTDDEWALLRNMWKRRPAEWQLCLAYVLDVGPVKETVAILVEMLESMNLELMEAALEALPPDLPKVSISEDAIARLLKKPERFSPNPFLEHPNLPRLLAAADRPLRKE